MHELTTRFVDALGKLHQDGEVDPLVDLFSDEATLSKAGIPHRHHGKDGARTFWEQYREVFDTIESSFSHRLTEDGVAFLEWSSTGSLRDGTDFRYDGVSILESDGDTIDAFRTYYDTAAFLSAEKRSAVGG